MSVYVSWGWRGLYWTKPQTEVLFVWYIFENKPCSVRDSCQTSNPLSTFWVCPQLYSVAHVCVCPQLYSVEHVCVCVKGMQGALLDQTINKSLLLEFLNLTHVIKKTFGKIANLDHFSLVVTSFSENVWITDCYLEKICKTWTFCFEHSSHQTTFVWYILENRPILWEIAARLILWVIPSPHSEYVLSCIV